MNPWSVQQYNDIKRTLVLDIDSLSRRLELAKKRAAEEISVESHCTARQEIKKLEKYLAEAKFNLSRFEFRYTHYGRGPEEWNEELKPDDTERKRRKRTTYPKDIDFDTLVVINPKTNKPYPVYKLKALYRDGKLDLSK